MEPRSWNETFEARRVLSATCVGLMDRTLHLRVFSRA
jgi:hypothetical protein